MPKRLCVGYSGGLDSQVLLHMLAAIRDKRPGLELEAVHVHHGLHSQADSWADHCQKSCDALSVPLTIYHVNPKEYPDLSLEAAARTARYAAFKAHLGDVEDIVLVLAHHLDDQFETILQRLCRGTGVLGLSGMSVLSKTSTSLKVFRPFLAMQLDRVALEKMATQRSLTWIEDSSNADPRFDRNFLRHEILPKLKARWPSASLAANRTALLCREVVSATQKTAQQVDALYCSSSTKSDTKLASLEAKWDSLAITTSLSAKKLLTLSSKDRRDILRVWLQEKGLYLPSFDQLGRVEREVLTAASGRKPRLKLGDYVIARWQDRLFVYRAAGALV